MITDLQKREWIYRLSNLPARSWPFAHAILADTIPPDLYAAMLANLPPHEEFVPLHSTGRIGKGAYPQRFVYMATEEMSFWDRIRAFLLTPEFALALARPFGKLAKHLEQNPQAWMMDTLLIEDLPGYRIGAHADASHKVLSALFYLGEMNSMHPHHPEWGTSIYQPKDTADVDPQSGQHYEFADFDRISTVPYMANHGLAFVKSDTSWHGVEQIPSIDGERRIVLLADIKLRR